MKQHVFIDFEASSLSESSYPISFGMHDIHSKEEGYFIKDCHRCVECW